METLYYTTKETGRKGAVSVALVKGMDECQDGGTVIWLTDGDKRIAAESISELRQSVVFTDRGEEVLLD